MICLSPHGQVQSKSENQADVILLATINGVYALTRGADAGSWHASLRGLEGKHISALLFDPVSQLLLAGVHSASADDGGLFVSADGGKRWERHTVGLEEPHIYMLAMELRKGKPVFYAGTEPAALYRSRDLTASWEKLSGLNAVPDLDKWTFPSPPHIAHVKTLAFHPDKAGVYYALVEQGALLLTEDDGASWREIASYASDDDSFYKDVHRLAIAPSGPSRMYLASGNGFYSTENAGKTWTQLLTRDDRIGYPEMLFLDPEDDSTIYIGGASDAPVTWHAQGGAHPGFMVSHDRGKTWQESNSGLPDPVRGNIEAISMLVTPEDLTFFAATSVGDVFMSSERGRRWTQIAKGLPPISKGRRYRHFLSAKDKAQIEDQARAERRAAGLPDQNYESTPVVETQKT